MMLIRSWWDRVLSHLSASLLRRGTGCAGGMEGSWNWLSMKFSLSSSSKMRSEKDRRVKKSSLKGDEECIWLAMAWNGSNDYIIQLHKSNTTPIPILQTYPLLSHLFRDTYRDSNGENIIFIAATTIGPSFSTQSMKTTTCSGGSIALRLHQLSQLQIGNLLLGNLLLGQLHLLLALDVGVYIAYTVVDL